MKLTLASLCFAFLSCYAIIYGQQVTPVAKDSLPPSPEELGLETIDMESIKGQMEYLASAQTEGRALGTAGAYKASFYIKERFKKYGLKGFAQLTAKEDSTDYYQYFDALQYAKDGLQSLAIQQNKNGVKKALHLKDGVDFKVDAGTVSEDIDSPIVFVGYGMQHPALGYNDFRNLDVRGKIIVRCKGYPGHRDTTSVAYKAFRWMKLKDLKERKDKVAKLAGAAAVITIDPDQHLSAWAKNKEVEIPKKRSSPYYQYRYDIFGANYQPKTLHLQLSTRMVNLILDYGGIDVVAFEKQVANNINILKKSAFSNLRMVLKTKVKSNVLRVRNVLGVIPGKLKDEYVLVGAHHDHLGKHGQQIWYGADDNASGVVGVLQLAKACMATGVQPRRGIIFATWTGEECGLLGSRYFTRKINPATIKVAMNYDMISRNADWDKKGNKCSMIYTQSLPYLAQVTKEHNMQTKLDINYAPMENPVGGSDQGSFAEIGVPVSWFFIGSHDDYHQVSDLPTKANWSKMQRIIKLGFLNLWRFANEENYE